VLSIYFQDPSTMDFTALEAGVATLPATVAMVAITPFVARLAARMGSRQVIGGGFLVAAIGFALLALVKDSWSYSAFVIPLILAAVGMGFSNGPSSSIATACVEPKDVGAASGISNMARYVGSSVGVALAATLFNAVSDHALSKGHPEGVALAHGLAAAAIMMAVVSALGVLLALLARRHRPRPPEGVDYAAAASGIGHTVPTSPTPEPAAA